uniref:HisB protein n=1 Tax=Fopius arisanus TaxID=64838 RepID=A0A0C9R4R8_9HYME
MRVRSFLHTHHKPQNVSVDDDFLGDKGREIFSEMTLPLKRTLLGVGLKNRAWKNDDQNLQHEVIDELSTIPRAKRYANHAEIAGILLDGGEGSSEPLQVNKVPADPLGEEKLEGIDILARAKGVLGY